MRNCTAFAIWLLATSTAAAPAAPTGKPRAARPDIELPVEGVVTNPDWLEKPTADQVASVYPTLPQWVGLAGRAKLDCTVSVQGVLQNCSVIAEIPAGVGFGQAAMALAPSFRMRPRTVDGAAVGGGEVHIPIHFMMPPTMAASQSGSAAAKLPAPTASKLALARKLMEAVHSDSRLQTWLQLMGEKLQLVGAQAPQSDEEQKVLTAVTQAALAAGQDELQERQARLARDLSEGQLTEMIAFFGGSTGQAWLTAIDDIDKSEAQSSEERSTSMMADARRRFCQAVPCDETPASK